MSETLQSVEGRAVIAGKMQAVIADIDYLHKDGSGNGYTYVSEPQVAAAVRASFLKHGIALSINVEGAPVIGLTASGKQTLVTCTYRFDLICTETGYAESVTAVGQGSDSTDKAASKALTSALKYGLLRTFLIPSGDETDGDYHAKLAEQDKAKKQAKEASAEQEVIPADVLAEVKENLRTLGFKLPKITARIGGLKTVAAAQELLKQTRAEIEKKQALAADAKPVKPQPIDPPGAPAEPEAEPAKAEAEEITQEQLQQELI